MQLLTQMTMDTTGKDGTSESEEYRHDRPYGKKEKYLTEVDPNTLNLDMLKTICKDTKLLTGLPAPKNQ